MYTQLVWYLLRFEMHDSKAVLIFSYHVACWCTMADVSKIALDQRKLIRVCSPNIIFQEKERARPGHSPKYEFKQRAQLTYHPQSGYFSHSARCGRTFPRPLPQRSFCAKSNRPSLLGYRHGDWAGAGSTHPL